jgi:peptidoglycan/xylan/chitin deacetylase (PgdA/CDA1 family)
MKNVNNSLAVILIGLSASVVSAQDRTTSFEWVDCAIIRGPTGESDLALVFTGDEYGDGLEHVRKVLKEQGVPASFFFTGRFYRNPDFTDSIDSLVADGHYLGAHSDQHLLYNSWDDRDSLLVSREEFNRDVLDNYAEMESFGIARRQAPYFMPPYEWYNRQIAEWTEQLGLQLINYTPGTRSHADYTTPEMAHYESSDEIYASILDHAKDDAAGLNGFILLAHVGTAPERTDKFYIRLDDLVVTLKGAGYTFVRIDRLLEE